MPGMLPVNRKWLRGAAVVAGGFAILYVVLRWFEHHQVYFPTRDLVATPDALRRPWEEVWFTASDGVRLHGWFFPAAPNSARSRWAVLHCHGNGGNLSHRLAVYAALLETGVNVLGFDYRGYGRSSGRPGEAGTYLDAQAAYGWLRQRGFAGTNVVAFGESLGGGVASGLAALEPVGGLILQSTFTSVPDIGAELFPWLPVRWIASIRYDTLGRLPALRVPVVIMHSRADRLIRFHHAERNHAAAREPKVLWEIAGDHNDALDADPARFVGGLERLIELLEPAGSTPPSDEPKSIP